MEESTGLQALELQGLSSGRAIAGVALPAIVLNAAPPIVIAVQTALVGRYASTSALAAFAAVGTCVAFVARAANFLVDGVSSRVGKTVGQRAWSELPTHVHLSVRWSALLGIISVPPLLLLRRPLLAGLLDLAGDVQQVAAGYWVVRSAAIPAQLLAMAAAGILQGFGRVRLNAGLTSAAALLEMAGSAAVLLLATSQPPAAGLLAMGWVSLVCQALLAAASLACIVALPPVEAKGRVHLLRAALGLGSSDGTLSSSSGIDGGGSGAGQAQLSPASEPLLEAEDRAESALPLSRPAISCTSFVGPRRAGGRHAARAPWFDQATREFLRDGLNMFLRTLVLQLTFFLALAAAARLGTAVLAAHSIVGQLWVVISYAVDGFAAAGIVLGSRLYGFARSGPQLRAAAERHMRRLTARVLWSGGLLGAAAGLGFHLARGSMPHWFTSDPAVVEALLGGGAWTVLALAQPMNGLLFVFDGLMYATQAFRYVRDYMALGFALVFLPALALEAFTFPSLANIWLAKAALNVWRLAGAAHLIYWRFLPRFGLDKDEGREGAARQAASAAAADTAAANGSAGGGVADGAVPGTQMQPGDAA
ncbi:MATE efflux family [Chlorella sorokiniana]|uniref:Protein DETOXIFICATION n=1 Tax=Chlorella sorokiniana TaxID=3076 RepID=A0A2P6TWM2_CHLSO|nr:MATE efflux family [Chlorella sorokiniana]|eukprot:PRW58447.1 MATE efflux family [Chlorella sorokiniana]